MLMSQLPGRIGHLRGYSGDPRGYLRIQRDVERTNGQSLQLSPVRSGMCLCVYMCVCNVP